MKKCEITLTHGQAILIWPDSLTDEDIADMTALLKLQIVQISRGQDQAQAMMANAEPGEAER